jgi:TetR/AcrR family transcriptional repressor of nem operon
MDGHISLMSRVSNREKILCAGLQVVHEHGFASASVRDIVQAAGVPQGSFTNHFVSKEAFGLEVIDLYYESSRELFAETLLNDARSPLERMEAFIDAGKDKLNETSMRNGCLLGNFTAETVSDNELIRDKLLYIFEQIEAALAYCLRAAVQAGEVPADLDVDETAAFIVQSMQGANLLSKAYRDAAPIDRFKKNLFDKLLK